MFAEAVIMAAFFYGELIMTIVRNQHGARAPCFFDAQKTTATRKEGVEECLK